MSNFFFKSHAGPHHLIGRRGHGIPEGPRSLKENVPDQEEAGACGPIRSHQTRFNIFVHWPGSCRKRPSAPRTVKEGRVPQIIFFFASFARTTRTRTSRRPSKPRRKRWRPRRGRNLQTDPKPPDQFQHFCTLARELPKETKGLEERKGGQSTTNTFFFASFDRTTRTRTSRRPSKPRRKRWRPRRGRNLQTNPKPPDQIRHFCTLAREPPKKTESIEDRKGGQGTTNTSFCISYNHVIVCNISQEEEEELRQALRASREAARTEEEEKDRQEPAE